MEFRTHFVVVGRSVGGDEGTSAGWGPVVEQGRQELPGEKLNLVESTRLSSSPGSSPDDITANKTGPSVSRAGHDEEHVLLHLNHSLLAEQVNDRLDSLRKAIITSAAPMKIRMWGGC